MSWGATLRLLWGVFVFHAVAVVLCSLAHHLLALLLHPPPAPTALPSSTAQYHDFGALDRLCARVCESLYALVGSVTLGPSPRWLRAHAGLLVRPEGYHSDAASAAAPGQYFEGWYYKAVLGDHGEGYGQRSIVFIPGVLHEPAGGDGFGFVIAVDSAAPPSRRARLFRYPKNATGPASPRLHEGDWAFVVGPNRFSAAGATVRLDIRDAVSCEVSGDEFGTRLGDESSPLQEYLTNRAGGVECGAIMAELTHHHLQPLPPSLAAPDAMGWLAYLPNGALPCRHGVVSMAHRVVGTLVVDGAPAVEVLSPPPPSPVSLPAAVCLCRCVSQCLCFRLKLCLHFSGPADVRAVVCVSLLVSLYVAHI